MPREWWPQVNRWLKRMGYCFALRKFTYPSTMRPGGELKFTSWWENQGVAPCYRRFRLALRLSNSQKDAILVTKADLRSWLPGDNHPYHRLGQPVPPRHGHESSLPHSPALRHIATFLPGCRPVRKIPKPLQGVTRMSDLTMVLTSLSGTTRDLQECHMVCEFLTPTGPEATRKDFASTICDSGPRRHKADTAIHRS